MLPQLLLEQQLGCSSCSAQARRAAALVLPPPRGLKRQCDEQAHARGERQAPQMQKMTPFLAAALAKEQQHPWQRRRRQQNCTRWGNLAQLFLEENEH